MAAEDIVLPKINRRGFKRQVPMEVLCLGLSRSGTDSLCRALTILGIPTYHGFNCSYSHWDCTLWWEAWDAKYNNKGKLWTRQDFDQVLGDYSATTDFPAAGFPVDLIQAYPEAKVILNSRPFDSWQKSYLNAFQIPLVENRTLSLLTQLDWECRTVWNFWIAILQQYFRYDWRRNCKQVYDEHNAVVRGAAPKDRFLEWDVTQGWEPLCAFLGKPVPDQPFPSGNSMDVLVKRIQQDVMEPNIKRGIRRLQIVLGTVVVVSGIVAARYIRPAWFQNVASKVFRT